MKRIILTGGGTAGHVTPNIALLPRLKELGYDIHYIGSYTGIEKELIEQFGIPYHGISSGKLRRYFSIPVSYTHLSSLPLSEYAQILLYHNQPVSQSSQENHSQPRFCQGASL